jgi:hypothetical protein
VGKFASDDNAAEYLNQWMKKNGITEIYGKDIFSTYFKTETGIVESHVDFTFTGDVITFDIEIELTNKNIPVRKFKSIRKNKNNTCNFTVNDAEFKVQITSQRAVPELAKLGGILKSEAYQINGDTPYSKNNKIETMYFYVAKIEGDIENVIGILELTYMAVLDSYRAKELSADLGEICTTWGDLGYAIQKYGCGIGSKKGITPYVLFFETIHGEIPYNKYLDEFMENNEYVKELLKTAAKLTAKYIDIPEEYITVMSLSMGKDPAFQYSKEFGNRNGNIYVNHIRLAKDPGSNIINIKDLQKMKNK